MYGRFFNASSKRLPDFITFGMIMGMISHQTYTWFTSEETRGNLAVLV